jgi:hypothetical protein
MPDCDAFVDGDESMSERSGNRTQNFNEMKDVFGAGVMIWKLNYAGGFRCKGVKSPIEFYQRLPGLEFRAVYVSQKELDQFVRLVNGPAKKGK